MLYPHDPEARQRYVRLHQGLHAAQQPGQRATERTAVDNTLLTELYTLKAPEMQERHAQGRLGSVNSGH